MHTITPHTLCFLRPAGTSRGVMHDRKVWFATLTNKTGQVGIGEIAPLPGLSPELTPDFEPKIPDFLRMTPSEQPSSIRFAIETAQLDMLNGGNRLIFPGAFTQGKQRIPINGLIWMGTKEYMLEQIQAKFQQGFRCLKLKIGAINFADELSLLTHIRNRFSAEELELRVDANGAFSTNDAMKYLEALTAFNLHSIEQPIKAGQWQQMAELCQQTPIPIALDEELIGIAEHHQAELLNEIKPQFIILKPSLHGGFSGCDRWITLATERGIGWWITSALESNIGLNAIAQYAAAKRVSMPQGLGTGQLFENNFPCPLALDADEMHFNSQNQWDLSTIL